MPFTTNGTENNPKREGHFVSFKVNGNEIYIQPEPPSNPEDGDVWFDIS